MEQGKGTEMGEFRSLITAIKAQAGSLEKAILSQEEEDEQTAIFNEYDETILVQVFSTLNHLVNYQAYGWRELIDGGDDSEDGTGPEDRVEAITGISAGGGRAFSER